jgi:hypothetical protein
VDADICNNILTADKNFIQARIADITADMGNFELVKGFILHCSSFNCYMYDAPKDEGPSV